MLNAILVASALAGPPAKSAAAVVASAERAISRADNDWISAIKARDAERLAQPYGPDAIFVTRDGKVISGRTAIVEYYRARFAAGQTIESPHIARTNLAHAGDGLIVERGYAGFESLGADGRRTKVQGPYLTVWRRDASGAWKILRNLVF